MGYVLAVGSNHAVTTPAGRRVRCKDALDMIPEQA